MKKIFIMFITSLVMVACERSGLKNLVDFEKVQNELNCDIVTEEKFKNYFIERDSEDLIYKDKYPSYIVNKNNEIVFFCEISEDRFDIVFWKDDKITDKIRWYHMGYLEDDNDDGINLNLFRDIENWEDSNINKKIFPRIVLSLPSKAVYFAKYNNEWFFYAVD